MSVWENKIKRRTCSSMSSCLLFLRVIGRTGRELRRGRGVNLSSRAYMCACAPPWVQGETLEQRREASSDRRTALQTWTVLSEPATSTDYLLKQQPVCGGDSADLVGQFYSREGVRKFGEMHSVYLVSLLFIFSTLHVNQLTEGCSCALTHPQDAFCNSDIGG